MTKERELWVDVVKGLAILGVVLQHSFQRTINYYGMEDSVWLNISNTLINSVNMQWFFAVSGYVYFLRRDKYLKDTRFFVKTRFVDLIIPYLIFGPVIWLGKFLLSAYVHKQVGIENLLEMFYKPVAFMWFIYALFFIEVLIFMIDKWGAGYDKKLVLYFFIYVMGHLTIGGKGESVLTMTPYFMFWYYAGGFFLQYSAFVNRNACSLCALGGGFWIFFFTLDTLAEVHLMGISSVLYTIGSVTFILLFCRLYAKNGQITRVFNYFGRKTMYLYILNPISINGIRVLLVKLGITNMYVNLFLFFIGAVVISSIVAEIAQRVPVVEFIFSPRKYLIKKK